MKVVESYPIGTSGQKWGLPERAAWKESRVVQRSYAAEVVSKLDSILGFTLHQYGTLQVEGAKEYPLFAMKSKNWKAKDKPTILVTGGVHGYETSGVQGCIQFLQTKALQYSVYFNIVVAPCVCPWGYECVERWNAQAVDPNRSFNPEGEIVQGRSFNPEAATLESAQLIQFLKNLGVDQWMCHIDCHETTDTDKTEFCPAKRARDGVVKQPVKDGEVDPDSIPDGFYLVSDSTNPQTDWHKAMIDSVRKITHIAPSESDGTIIGEPVVQEGVITIPAPKSLGLCAGVTNANYVTTTEVYPDSPHATPEQCNDAQVACIVGGLDFIIQKEGLLAETEMAN